MERLQILAIGVQIVFGFVIVLYSYLRNFPARLFIPVFLLVLSSFNIFRIHTELTFSNLSCFFFDGS